MTTVDASTLLEDAYRMIGWDPDQLETRHKQMARQSLSLALEEVWEAWWWEELMQSLPLPASPVYDAATAYAAGAFVYFPATQKFYQALQATTGNDPALPVTTGTTNSDDGYATNVTYWARARAQYDAPLFIPGTAYALGDQARDTLTPDSYQLISPVQGVVLDPGVFTLWQQNSTLNGAPRYAGDGWTCSYDGTQWVFIESKGALPNVDSDPVKPPTTPDQATYASNTVTATVDDTAPSASDKWALLVPFVPDVPLAGVVRDVGRINPRNGPNCGRAPFELSADGIRLPGWNRGVPWVWWRLPTPVLTGDTFDATATYSATPASRLCIEPTT